MGYPNLFSEGRIGQLRLKNRVVMPSMGTTMASADGEVTDHQIAYFEERAKGGVGLIITEVTSVEYTLGKGGSTHPRVDDNKYIPMLSRLANAIHKHDAKVFMQLQHSGRQSYSMLTGGQQIVAPSPIACNLIGEVPRELELAEIEDLISRFVMGAVRCKMAGIDGVELHGAHGYLINQFLSPQSNRRTDAYGGSFENRMRFTRKIIEGIKKECGPEYPVVIRLSVDEFVEGGINLTEGVKIARYMETLGVDAINVSCGTYESIPTVIEPVTYEQGWRTYLAEAVRKEVNIPVITVGVIRKPEFAETILKEKKADFVAIGRGLIADPEWCNKASADRGHEIRKCISCMHCIESGMLGVHLTCGINARAGRELEFKDWVQDGDGRKVVVVGGGPGGLEAARILSRRGFRVVLFEQETTLGGQIRYGNKPRGKAKMNWLVDYLAGELRASNVEIRLNETADYAKIAAEEPYAVFVATGGSPVIPKIPGIDGAQVMAAEKALTKHLSYQNQKVAVIGAGMTGCETAELIASQGNDVWLIEMMPEIATGISPISRMDIDKHLSGENVKIYTGHKLKEITPEEIVIENLSDHQELRLGVDSVVISLGVNANDQLYEMIKDKFDLVQVLGDALKPRKIAYAVREGFEKAWLLN